MAEHTPGPWWANQEYNQFGAPIDGYWKVETARVRIADVMGEVRGEQDEDGGDVYLSNAESGANARLIAAAPELLEAARKVLEVLFDAEPLTSEENAAIDALEAAIAKAEGKD